MSHIGHRSYVILLKTSLLMIKSFGKLLNHSAPIKSLIKKTINLVEKDTILSDDQVVANTFNNYFNNIVKNLLAVTNKNVPTEKNKWF